MAVSWASDSLEPLSRRCSWAEEHTEQIRTLSPLPLFLLAQRSPFLFVCVVFTGGLTFEWKFSSFWSLSEETMEALTAALNLLPAADLLVFARWLHRDVV